jgi:hypothetical protein
MKTSEFTDEQTTLARAFRNGSPWISAGWLALLF